MKVPRTLLKLINKRSELHTDSWDEVSRMLTSHPIKDSNLKFSYLGVTYNGKDYPSSDFVEAHYFDGKITLKFTSEELSFDAVRFISRSELTSIQDLAATVNNIDGLGKLTLDEDTVTLSGSIYINDIKFKVSEFIKSELTYLDNKVDLVKLYLVDGTTLVLRNH